MHFLGVFVSGEKIEESYKRFTSKKGKIILYEDKKIVIEKDFRYSNKFICGRYKEKNESNFYEYSQVVNISKLKSVTLNNIPVPIKIMVADHNDFILHSKNDDWVFISADACGNEIIIRPKRDGDFLIYNGSAKKIKYFYSDAKLDHEEKIAIPIIDSLGKVAAVCIGLSGKGHSRVSDAFRVTADTKKILAICRAEQKD